jgi:hypothetical protein
MESNSSARNPDQQFQIGDSVLYVPEGVYATIDGYIWMQTIGQVPKIAAYKLSIGISVPENSIIHKESRSI